jgi:hypothetical protein
MMRMMTKNVAAVSCITHALGHPVRDRRRGRSRRGSMSALFGDALDEVLPVGRKMSGP